MRRALPLCLLLAAVAGCQCDEHTGWEADEVDYGLIKVARDNLRLTSGPVGIGRFRSEASYVLIDAKNTYSEDLLVTLGGHLVDAGGHEVADLRRQSLRVPGDGGVRMFSLIDKSNQLQMTAVGAVVEVRGAMKVDYPSPVVVIDGRVDIDQDRAVVAGNVVNTTARETAVIVFAGFYDADGAPLKQTSTKLKIAGKGRRGVQFVGPEGSRRAYLYTGVPVF